MRGDFAIVRSELERSQVTAERAHGISQLLLRQRRGAESNREPAPRISCQPVKVSLGAEHLFPASRQLGQAQDLVARLLVPRLERVGHQLLIERARWVLHA